MAYSPPYDEYKLGSKTVAVGYSALARDCGVSVASVMYHIARGKTVNETIEHYKRKGTWRGDGRPAAPSKQAIPSPSIPTKPATPSAPTPARTSIKLPKPRFAGGPGLPERKPAIPASQTSGSGSGIAPPPLPKLGRARVSQSESTDKSGQPETIHAAQLRRVIALADKEELANAQKRGELVSLERIRNFCTGIVRETIERITQVPGNIQDRVASESDPNRCGAAMREELQRVVDKIREMEELWKTQS